MGDDEAQRGSLAQVWTMFREQANGCFPGLRAQEIDIGSPDPL